MARPEHPNEPGRWTLIEADGRRALWRRDRSDPYPVAMFYVLAPPAQARVVYSEDVAQAIFAAPGSSLL